MRLGRASTFAAAVAAVGTLGSAHGVVGGRPADPGEYPWMAAIYRGQSPSGGQFCGGSLVRPTLVATAAHCVNELLDGTVAQLPVDLLGRKLKVMVGRHTLNGTGGEQIVVKSVHEYPGGGPGAGDIAVLELVDPSTQTTLDWARPGQGPLFAPGVVSTVIGWGTTSEGGRGSNELLEAEVPIVSDATCQEAYPEVNPELEICAGYPDGGVDTCQGDSGGPLMVPGPTGGAFLLAGITSWGEGCARPARPGVYAEVAALADFIEQFV